MNIPKTRAKQAHLAESAEASGATANRISGSVAAVSMLQEFGVKHIFGVCGDTSLPFYDALRSVGNSIRHVLARDERCAAYMADVYARITGRVGVVEGPSGAGATYMLPGIVEAQGTTIPVLAITSDIPVTGRDKFVLTECDQESLFRPFTKYTRVVEQATCIPTAFRAAFTAMTSGTPGTAHIGLPYDVLKADLPANDVWGDPTLGQYPSRPQQPDDDKLEAAAELIRTSRRPIIITGGGTLHAMAHMELIQLAEIINAPVGTTISAKGTIAETHELALGTIGTNGSTPGARDAVRESDLVIYVGCRVGSVTSEKGANPVNGEKPIIHIDIDPICIGANYKTDVALPGHAKLTLAALIKKLEARQDRSVQSGWGREAVCRAKDIRRALFMKHAASNDVPIYPERIIAEMQKALPDDVIVISDPGTPTPYLCAFYETRQSGRSFIFHRFHGGLGFSLPGVVGAYFAAPGRKIVGIMGDGSFGFSSGELETISRLNLPVTLIVINNASFGWIKAGQQQSYGGRFFGVDFSKSDHAAIAAAYGLKTWKVERPEQLAGALSKAIASAGPTLVEIITRPLEQSEVPVTAYLG